jgi:peptide/nickel transport system substrate-binding protein
VISNGPFYLETYSPESRTIQVKAFEDNSYPFEIGTWSKFESMQFPSIKKINMQKIIQQGESTQINIETEGVTSLLYFILDSEGRIQTSEESEIKENNLNINLTSDITKKLQSGTNQIKIFGISDLVLKPDIYETNFIIVKEKSEIPKTEINVQNIENEINYDVWVIGIIILVIIIAITIFLKKRF